MSGLRPVIRLLALAYYRWGREGNRPSAPGRCLRASAGVRLGAHAMTTFESEAAAVAQRTIERARRPACQSGACEQGRKPCPSRQACQLPESEDDDGLGDLLGAGMVCLVSVICIAVVVAAL